MRAFQFPSRLWREYDRSADGCQHFFFDNAKKSFASGKSRRKTALIGKKESSELANRHSYWGFLIWAAISGYSEKIWGSMFTECQRSTFLLNKKQCTNDWVNTRKSLKYKGFRSIGDTERVCMVSYIIYIYIFTHVTVLLCYSRIR